MTERAIYNKAIFHREQQMDRKVYQRARNVLPTDGEDKKYYIYNVDVLSAGSGYQENDEMAVTSSNPDDEPGVITVAAVTPELYGATEVSQYEVEKGIYGYEANETITIPGGIDGDDAIITIESVDQDGVPTSLIISNAGSYDFDISDNYDYGGKNPPYEYTGNGAGLGITITGSVISAGGGVDNINWTDGVYSSDLSGEYTLDSTTGSGASFSVTMAEIEEA